MEDSAVKSRIASIDLLRGMVMIIMALDHVREFWSVTPFRAEDVTQTSTLLFFTRWFTHLCAPTFVFLSGISLYLVEARKGKKHVAGFALTRGLWLILLQVFLLTFLFQFTFNFIILEIIWVLGWSMIIMGALIWLPRWVIASFALLVIAGHNLLPIIQPVTGENVVFAILHNTPAVLPVNNFPMIIIAYTIFPWVGVMAAGYALASWVKLDMKEQNTRWLVTGMSLLILFVVLRSFNGYGDLTPWSEQPRGKWFTFLSFLNVTKYPPSLDFLSLTLGVACLFIALFNAYKPPGSAILKVFGEVPFFFYIIHIPCIVAGAYLWTYIRFGSFVNLSFQPPAEWPAKYEPSLVRVYVVWIIYVILLYFPCKWYANYKRTHRAAWLSYI